jgi:hypothetical protein
MMLPHNAASMPADDPRAPVHRSLRAISSGPEGPFWGMRDVSFTGPTGAARWVRDPWGRLHSLSLGS